MKMLPDAQLDALTPRQLEILGLVAKGMSNGEVSKLLGISVNTVKVHLAALMAALEVANRTEAAAMYQRCMAEQKRPAPLSMLNRIGRPALAVLQLQRLGETEAEQSDHLADGLTQDLITRLAAWRWFPLIAYASSSRISAGDDVRKIGEQLGAAYLITGTLRQEPGRARLNINLWETEFATLVWSQALEFDPQVTLEVQDRLARQIVAHVAPELLSHAGTPSNQISEDYVTWRQMMRGMWYLAQRTPHDVAEARNLFEAALGEHPEMLLGWYGLVWVHHHALVEQWTEDADHTRRQLKLAVERCRALEPNAAQTQLVLGLQAMLDGERERAIAYLRRASCLNPSSTQALGLLGQCFCLSDEPEEAIAVVEEALLLNPYNPNTWAQRGVISIAHFSAGRFAQAAAVAEESLADRPNGITPRIVLVAVAVERGDMETAQTHRDALFQHRPDFKIAEYLHLIAPVAQEDQITRIEAAFQSLE